LRAEPCRAPRHIHAMSSHDEGISNRDFARLCSLIYAQSGITLSSDKKTMLELRIKRRLRGLELDSYSNYCDYLFSHQGQKDEIVHLLDVVTTNKTDFYREPAHFDYLVQKALPDLTARNLTGRDLLIWSAGCSTGEEPYTLSIVLTEYGLTHPGFRFKVLATDLSTTVLEKAHLGVFSSEVVRPIPVGLKKKYFLRGRDPASDRVRVVPELRKLVEFRHLNFMDADFGLAEKADVIFCRNVIIYFDRPTQEQILQKLARNLVLDGYIFVGHAEALHDMDLPLEPIAPAAYRKVDGRN
jgi:chemotaxis protein methyltransferase CheR